MSLELRGKLSIPELGFWDLSITINIIFDKCITVHLSVL